MSRLVIYFKKVYSLLCRQYYTGITNLLLLYAYVLSLTAIIIQTLWLMLAKCKYKIKNKKLIGITFGNWAYSCEKQFKIYVRKLSPLLPFINVKLFISLMFGLCTIWFFKIFFNINSFSCFTMCLGLSIIICALIAYDRLAAVYYINFLIGGFIFIFIGLIMQLSIFWIQDKYVLISVFEFYEFNSIFKCDLVFFCDKITWGFLILINFITILALLYTNYYFKYELETIKLSMLLAVFSISMSLLVSVDSWVLFFFFWEIIGITSFFLINFYYKNPLVRLASLKVLLFNKLSDTFLILGILGMYQICDARISVLDVYEMLTPKQTCFIVFFILASAIKSAQFGFHVWLPDSMEAPLPASSLLHSATLVSAGIYVILRVNYFVAYHEWLLVICGVWFSFTAFYGGLTSMYQTDIKKLLAYSTISHCGMMSLGAINGCNDITTIYLIFHGVFKAIAFMSAGVLILLTKTQDMQRFGNFWRKSIDETTVFFFSIINLSALPCFIGSYFKAFTLYSVMSGFIYQIIFYFVFLSCLTGVGYCSQVFLLLFFTENTAEKVIYTKLRYKAIYFSSHIYKIILLSVVVFCIGTFAWIWDVSALTLRLTNNVSIIKMFYSIVEVYLFILYKLHSRYEPNPELELRFTVFVVWSLLYSY